MAGYGTNGVMVDLGPGTAFAINAGGQVVGSSLPYSFVCEGTHGRAFLWTPASPNATNGTRIDLGPGVALGINKQGQIVGYYHNGSGTHG